jgi:hypothetical protein
MRGRVALSALAKGSLLSRKTLFSKRLSRMDTSASLSSSTSYHLSAGPPLTNALRSVTAPKPFRSSPLPSSEPLFWGHSPNLWPSSPQPQHMRGFFALGLSFFEPFVPVPRPTLPLPTLPLPPRPQPPPPLSPRPRPVSRRSSALVANTAPFPLRETNVSR